MGQDTIDEGDGMISDEVKQAIREAVNEKFQTCLSGEEIVRRVEAKLSPKHPPEGLYEVWLDCWIGNREMRLADGSGGWLYLGTKAKCDHPYDHYRRIPTAKDALHAVCDAVTDGEGGTYADGVDKCIDAIQRIIDNAQEG